MSEWISVEERLPDEQTDVLAWVVKSPFKAAAVTAGMFPDILGGDTIWMGWENEEPFPSGWDVTHWMPLPEPPK